MHTEENKTYADKPIPISSSLAVAVEAAVKAGRAIMDIYSKDFTVALKADRSPLTEADKESNAIIMHHLKPTAIPIISEENKQVPFDQRKEWKLCWIVDPLDGTKEFIKRNGEFTVNIALVECGVPIIGVVYVPAQRVLYFADRSSGSYKCVLDEGNPDMALNAALQQAAPLRGQAYPQIYTIVVSRSHLSPETEGFIAQAREKYGTVVLVSKGSSIKLCLVAEGKAHIYPRIAPTMEWDTAAAHAIAKYAGCTVKDFYRKEELLYNKEQLLNPYFIVAHE